MIVNENMTEEVYLKRRNYYLPKCQDIKQKNIEVKQMKLKYYLFAAPPPRGRLSIDYIFFRFAK